MPRPAPPRTLFDLAPPFQTELLPVTHGHALYVRQHGNPAGQPALVLHGGPGSGFSSALARFFDPAHYRLVCVDQRGAGRSLPTGCVAHNQTAHLLADLRAVHAHLGLQRWLVVGGSWGATLALLHAADMPQAVSGLLLRSTFLARQEDIDAFFNPQRHGLFATPGDWPLADYATATADAGAGAGPVVKALHAALFGDDRTRQQRAALHWWQWEQQLGASPAPASPPTTPDSVTLSALVLRYRIQSHYLLHACWLDPQGWPARCAGLPLVPTLLVHGAEDAVCPVQGARQLHAWLPGSQLQLLSGTGHALQHPAMVQAMVAAVQGFAEHGRFCTEDPP